MEGELCLCCRLQCAGAAAAAAAAAHVKYGLPPLPPQQQVTFLQTRYTRRHWFSRTQSRIAAVAGVRACVRACILTITHLCVCAHIAIITACSSLVQVDHPDFIRRITLDGQAVDAIVVWLSKQHGPRFVTGFPC